MIESWSTWERETLAEQHGDFEALLHHMGAQGGRVAQPEDRDTGPAAAPRASGRPPVSGPPKLRIV